MVASPELIIDGRSSNENVDNTKERVKSQVDKELQQLTNEIGKNFYKINENGEVEYDLNLVKKYLESIKDKQYSELKSKNTSAWIMTVQIALSSIGYDVGKIDGILKNKGARTSKTIEQIMKFQKDNGLKPDGQPGSKTITKLLGKLGPITIHDGDIEKNNNGENNNTENNNGENNNAEENNGEKTDKKEYLSKEKFDELCFKTSLTDEEMRQVVDYANKNNQSYLSLRITSIRNQNQLLYLGKIERKLDLWNIQNITNEQMKGLTNVETLLLNGLRKITLNQARIISKSKVRKLEMESLNGQSYTNSDGSKSSITDNIAYELSSLDELYINPSWLTENQKNILTNLK